MLFGDEFPFRIPHKVPLGIDFDDLHGEVIVLVDHKGGHPVGLKEGHDILEHQFFALGAVKDRGQHRDDNADKKQIKKDGFNVILHGFPRFA